MMNDKGAVITVQLLIWAGCDKNSLKIETDGNSSTDSGSLRLLQNGSELPQQFVQRTAITLS